MCLYTDERDISKFRKSGFFLNNSISTFLDQPNIQIHSFHPSMNIYYLLFLY